MSIQIGQIVGEYLVVQELGGGGHGRVYKVEHTITRRVEAIKVLAGGIPASEDQRRRFLREIQVQAQLCHPNIAAVHNAFWLGNNLVMAMEFIEGRSLHDLLAQDGVQPQVGMGYICQVLDALSHAHSQGIVHRDVSPANIIVGRAGLVKLTDFGLAKRVKDSSITTSGSLVGSLPYMSPEQVRGVEDPDGRSDIYSCGVILYQVVTGRKPFDSDCAFTLMRAHVELDPVPPSRIDARVAVSLSDMILKAMAKDPAERFQTAADFRVAIESLDSIPSASFPVPAVEPAARGGSQRTRFPVRLMVRLARSRVAGIAMGALFVTAVLGAVFWAGGSPRNTPDPPLAIVRPAPPPAPPAELQEPPAARPDAEPSNTLPKPGRVAPRRARPTFPTEPRRKSFRPPQTAKPPREVALVEPPALPVEMPGPNRPGANGELPEPTFAGFAEPQPADLPPPPVTGAGRVLRFLGKARVLNPFRQKAPKPAEEIQEK
ncbi:MAG: protein kinase [Bryobacterales bacterium]|nr:protein kinase [Bryobacterales bacterium]